MDKKANKIKVNKSSKNTLGQSSPANPTLVVIEPKSNTSAPTSSVKSEKSNSELYFYLLILINGYFFDKVYELYLMDSYFDNGTIDLLFLLA